MKILYFTATGNSLAVAKKLGGELISIAQVKDKQTFRDDVIGVVTADSPFVTYTSKSCIAATPGFLPHTPETVQPLQPAVS